MKFFARKDSGFTLVEVLVSVAIFAFMGAFVYDILRINFKSRKQAYRVQKIYHQAEVALKKLVRNISMAFISRHVDEDKSRKTLFIGKSDRILFTYLGHIKLNPEAKESDQGVCEFYLDSDKDTGKKALFLREKGIIDDDPDSGGKVIKIAENVKSLKFEYFSIDDEDWKNDWKAEMDELEPVVTDKKAKQLKKLSDELSGKEQLEHFILPDAVRIYLVFEDDEGHEYPFVTAVKIPMKYPYEW